MMKIYEIIWYDAHFNGECFTLSDVPSQTEPWIIKTVGYYAGKNEIDFKIAQEYHERSKKYGHIMSIPHSCIIKKTLLYSKKKS